jgi:membrane protease YdiL (CAAX protease family)
VRNRELDRPIAGFGLARAVGLILNYFVGHQFVYPLILWFILKSNDPGFTVYPLWSLIVLYGTTILVTLYLAWPLLAESWAAMRHHVGHTIRTVLAIFPLMYFTSIVLAVLIAQLSGQATSGNQTSLIELLGEFPVFTVILTVLFAPIVEELVFRGAFYRYFRAKGMYWMPMLLSASAFSYIHLSVALNAGHFSELWFFPLYAVLGAFLSVAYEKTGNIFGPILLHFSYNAFGLLIALIAR